MLLIKSKYKVAKRLGASIFEKTQTPKFALSDARSKKTKKRPRGGASDYGRQLLEKQKLRYTYGLSEKQLSKYVSDAFSKDDPSRELHHTLEMRADSAVYRAGMAPTRRAARQLVSHGHITVNDRRITTPSYRVRTEDVISVREGSRGSSLFAGFADDGEKTRPSAPAWISFDPSLLRASITGEPNYDPATSGLDYATVFEYYSR